MSNERDYVLGTHAAELARLGLQHRIWRERMLGGLTRAGLTVGHRVIDVGAGPGYVTQDLAEIVGPTGEVLAVERSQRYLDTLQAMVARNGLTNVIAKSLDLMQEPIPGTGYDLAWVRWVACFVSAPGQLVQSIAQALRPGGKVIFHEYVDYESFRLLPPKQTIHEFKLEVMKSWRDAGGEPNIAIDLPRYLGEAGFRITHTVPHVFAARPSDFVWQWPTSFIDVNVERLIELGRVTPAWGQQLAADWAAATQDERSVFITPMVLEIIAEKV